MRSATIERNRAKAGAANIATGLKNERIFGNRLENPCADYEWPLNGRNRFYKHINSVKKQKLYNVCLNNEGREFDDVDDRKMRSATIERNRAKAGAANIATGLKNERIFGNRLEKSMCRLRMTPLREESLLQTYYSVKNKNFIMSALITKAVDSMMLMIGRWEAPQWKEIAPKRERRISSRLSRCGRRCIRP